LIYPEEEPDQETARRWKRYRIMKVMHWTLEEYRVTPASFIEEVWMFLNTEAKAINDQMESK